MKTVKVSLFLIVLCAAALAQTKDLGNGVFFNDQGPIAMAVDASIVQAKLDSPYVMFVAYMGAQKNKSVMISRDSVSLTYKGQEYMMTPIKELEEKFHQALENAGLYAIEGHESLIGSQMRFWNYQTQTDFFPIPGRTLAVNEGSTVNEVGFRTRMYFNNPGFQKGDTLTIKVWDKKHPDLSQSIDVVLK